MHHSIRFYGGHRKAVLRFYMFGAKGTRLPLLGRLVRRVANAYGRSQHGTRALTLAEAEALVDLAEGVALAPCTCREMYHNCDNPVDTEILLGPARHIFMERMPHDSREITREEAKGVLRDCHRRGLIQTVARCQEDFYAICNCCTCCCIPLRLSRQYGIREALTRRGDIIAEFREYQVARMERA